MSWSSPLRDSWTRSRQSLKNWLQTSRRRAVALTSLIVLLVIVWQYTYFTPRLKLATVTAAQSGSVPLQQRPHNTRPRPSYPRPLTVLQPPAPSPNTDANALTDTRPSPPSNVSQEITPRVPQTPVERPPVVQAPSSETVNQTRDTLASTSSRWNGVLDSVVRTPNHEDMGSLITSDIQCR